MATFPKAVPMREQESAGGCPVPRCEAVKRTSVFTDGGPLVNGTCLRRLWSGRLSHVELASGADCQTRPHATFTSPLTVVLSLISPLSFDSTRFDPVPGSQPCCGATIFLQTDTLLLALRFVSLAREFPASCFASSCIAFHGLLSESPPASWSIMAGRAAPVEIAGGGT